MPGITKNKGRNMSEEKRFDEWIDLKSDLHKLKFIRSIHEGEVWWCAMGENVGVEINGKNAAFARPAIILKKFGRLGFMAIPLTSQPHEGSWYAHFRFQGKDEWAVLSQARFLSISRIFRRMGAVDDEDWRLIKRGFLELYK